MRTLILADKAGFCFGVKRAVDEALKVQKQYNKRVYTLGSLIHNNDAVDFLKGNDIYPIELDNIGTLNHDDVIIIRSHGIPLSTYNLLKDNGLTVIDATCPFVTNIQRKVNKYHALGYGIVIVGDPNHPEIIGINGWCDNTAIIYKDGKLSGELPKRVCIVSQTTEKQENWKKAVNLVSEACKEVVVFNTICLATEERQGSAESLSKEVDAMIVIGGKNSSNTTKLYEICRSNCTKTVHVERADEIPNDFLNDEYISKIGVTAGASTPDWIIKGALNKMSSENIQDMNDVLAYMDANEKDIYIGEIIKGKVISINKDGLFVGISYKAEAIIPKEEVSFDENISLEDLFKIGDEVEGKVIQRRNDNGYVVLSRKELEKESLLEELNNLYENNQNIEVKVKEVINGGLLSLYKGIKVFIPASLVAISHVEDLSQFKNQTLLVRLIEFKKTNRETKIVASRKQLLLEEKENKDKIAWESFNLDDVCEGTVLRLTAFGAFVNINGVDGLLHISEMGWGKVTDPSKVLKIGETVKVKIIGLDKENRKLALSMKALIANPWDDIEDKYPVSNIALGKVVRFSDFGAFVELESGVDGLVHISQISHQKIEKPSDVLNIGENVKVKIINVNKEEKKIALSIKAAD